MIGAVDKRSLKTYNRETADRAMLCSLLQTLFYCGMEVLRNRAAEDLLLKDQIVAIMRCKLDLNVTVLTVTA